MTKEDKDLLLKDLCARLPYGIKCQIDYDNEEDSFLGIERYADDRIVSVCIETEEIGLYHASVYFYPEEIKPYLRPMSSMTEEEVKEIAYKILQQPDLGIVKNWKYLDVPTEKFSDFIDWLISHHFDYRGLIKKGLALEAPEGMYKTE